LSVRDVIDSATSAAIRAWASERRMPQAHIERWLAMDEADRAALLSVARALRMRTGAAVTALAILEEIAVRDRCSIKSVLERDEIARTISGPGSAPAKARAFLDALGVLRFPRLARAAGRLRTRVAALGLPRGVSVVLPKDLSNDELRIELRAKDGAELRRLIGELSANAEGLARIVDLLGGDDEF
jgi:hypothetical protein